MIRISAIGYYGCLYASDYPAAWEAKIELVGATRSSHEIWRISVKSSNIPRVDFRLLVLLLFDLLMLASTTYCLALNLIYLCYNNIELANFRKTKHKAQSCVLLR